MDFNSQVTIFALWAQDLSNRVHDPIVVRVEVDIKALDEMLVVMADELLKATFIACIKKGQRDFVVKIRRVPPDSDDGVAPVGGGGSRALCRGEAARQQ